MKNEKLHQAMGMIDNKYIEHAHAKRKGFNFNYQTVSRLALVIGAFAIVLMILPLPGFGFASKSEAIASDEDIADKYFGEMDYNDISNESEADGTTGLKIIESDSYTTGSGSQIIVKESSEQETSDIDTSSVKRIVTGKMEMASSDLDETIEKIESQIMLNDGYIQSETRDYYTSSVSSYSATIRIPAANYEEFKDSLYQISSVTYYDESTKDITEQYNDYQARLSVLQSEEATLVEFYGQAQSVSDLLEIEEQLSDVRSEIESIQTTLKNYDTLVAYSTLYLTVDQKVNIDYEEPDFLERLGYAFKDGFNEFIDGLSDCVINLVYNIWGILIVAILAGGVILFCKKKQKQKKEKETDQKSKEQNQ